jgi:hypothetical protein
MMGPFPRLVNAGGAERDIRLFENFLQLAKGNRPTGANALLGQPPYPDEEANP